MPSTQLLPGPFGFLRIDGFLFNAAEAAALRAVLEGERTAGGCGLVRSANLAPGWSIFLASHHTDFGPDEWQLNRVGVTPDVQITPTPADEAAGRDPQLHRALEILRTQTTAP